MNSCSFDISRLKKPAMPPLVATCCAMLSTRLVLPIDGRAATMIRSPRWNPRVILSISVKPVAMPVMKLLCSNSCSILGKLSLTRSRIATKPDLMRSSATEKIALSASSRIRSASWSASYALARILLAEKIRLRSVAFLLDDLGVILDVGGARHAVDERGDVGGAADFFELARRARAPPCSVTEIDRLAALGERDHAIEDAAVRVAEKRARVDDRRGDVEGFVVDQDRAEHRALRVEIVRKRAFGAAACCDVGHEGIRREVRQCRTEVGRASSEQASFVHWPIGLSDRPALPAFADRCYASFRPSPSPAR